MHPKCGMRSAISCSLFKGIDETKCPLNIIFKSIYFCLFYSFIPFYSSKYVIFRWLLGLRFNILKEDFPVVLNVTASFHAKGL